jgi:hypothetical protein
MYLFTLFRYNKPILIEKGDKMSWAELTYDQKIEIYKEIFKESMESPRNADLVIQEMMIQAHLLSHDFTKRQLVIITFILTLSFSFGKSEAYIEKLKDFQLAGISEKHINTELKKLVTMNVIKMNKEEKLYSIEDPRKWDCPINAGYSNDRARQLFYLNISHAGIDITPFMKKKNEM